MKRPIAAAGLTAIAIGSVALVGASSASAYPYTAVNQGINDSFYYASSHGFSMAPMTPQAIGDKIVLWCDTKAARLAAGYSQSGARTSADARVASTIGSQKTTAIRFGADKDVC